MIIDLTTDDGRAEFEKLMGAKQNKYGAQKVHHQDGYTFDSIGESQRYEELKLLQRAGIISDLVVHPTFVLQEGYRLSGKAIRPVKYVSDFQYIENGIKVVEDFKSEITRTRSYLDKVKLFKKRYGHEVEFREVIR